jgi:hypothetical protein
LLQHHGHTRTLTWHRLEHYHKRRLLLASDRRAHYPSIAITVAGPSILFGANFRL